MRQTGQINNYELDDAVNLEKLDFTLHPSCFIEKIILIEIYPSRSISIVIWPTPLQEVTVEYPVAVDWSL
jgi:hypothetical protein